MKIAAQVECFVEDWQFTRSAAVHATVEINLLGRPVIGKGNRARRRLHDIRLLAECRELDATVAIVQDILTEDGPRAYCPHPGRNPDYDPVTRHLPYPGEDDNGELLCSPPQPNTNTP